MEEHYIPKYLNAQIQILWWEIDQIIAIFSGLIIGIFSNRIFLGLLIGGGISYVYTKIKGSHQPGFLKHICYAVGLYNVKERFPEYYIKEFVR
jgi:conjugal transfer pilus assembly protein TraL